MKVQCTGIILESKDIRAIFQKKEVKIWQNNVKKEKKKDKIFENLGKNVKNLKIF